MLIRSPRGAYNDTFNAQSYTASSATPAANELLLAWVTHSDTVTPSEVTPSGWGLTWTVEETLVDVDGQARLTLCSATTGSTSPGSGAFTADVAAGAGNQSGCIINVVGYTDDSGAVPTLAQVVTDNSGVGSDPVLDTLATLGSSSWVEAAFSLGRAAPAATPDGGWTEAFDGGYSTPGTGQWLIHSNGVTSDNTPGGTWFSSDFIAIAAEIRSGAGELTGDPIIHCIWSDGSQGDWYDTSLYAAGLQEFDPGAIRQRGNHGGLTNPMYNSRVITSVAAGRIASLEINCRGDNQGNYFPYSQVLNGDWDAELHQRGAEVAALGFASGGRKHMLELQSEVDLAKHDSGTPAEARAFQRYVKAIFVEEGVDNVWYTVSCQQARYDPPEDASQWMAFDVVEIAAADGYDKPWSVPGAAAKSFEGMFDPLRNFAIAHGLKWAVPETGVEEHPTDSNYKANWYAEQKAYLEAHPDAFLITDNYSADGFSGAEAPWYFDTTPQALAAQIDKMNSFVWTIGAGVTDSSVKITYAELRVSDANRKSFVFWSELEVPDAARGALVSFAEMRFPDLAIPDRVPLITWAELEIPTAPRQVLLSWAELEAPTAPRQVYLFVAELEAPDAPRGVVLTYAEAEIPEGPITTPGGGMSVRMGSRFDPHHIHVTREP